MSLHATLATRSARPGPLSRLIGHLSRSIAMRQHRRALLRLEPHLLRDIGLTEAEALRAAQRPFWDAPAHWRG